MEFCGYPADDIALFQHMYKGTFLFLGNPTVFHTSEPDAVPRMQAIIGPIGAYLRWSGLLINMLKSKISAIDFSTGGWVAIDSIRHKDAAFPVLLPDQAHKHLGMRMSLTGDFSQEKLVSPTRCGCASRL